MPEEDIKSPWADYDWKAAQDGIALLFERDLRTFIAGHKEELFYSVAVDCNSLYGDILLSANTLDALRRSASSFTPTGTEEELAFEIEEMRWGFGDWEYHGFNYRDDGGFSRYKRLLPETDAMEHPDDRTWFLECVTRALLQAEASGALADMRKTTDFKVMCKDDEEELVDAEERIRRLRAADS